MKIEIDVKMLEQLEKQLVATLEQVRAALKCAQQQMELFNLGVVENPNAESNTRDNLVNEYLSALIEILPGQFSTRDVVSKARVHRPEFGRGKLLKALNGMATRGAIVVEKAGAGRRPTQYRNPKKVTMLIKTGGFSAT